jgi:hypothetical protein
MHASKADLPATVVGDYEGRTVDWDGTRVAYESMPAHFPPDESPFAGLPDDRCQCPHWGYLVKGSFSVAYVDGPDEVVHAGDVYYLRPGHFVQTLEPVELVEFSPAEQHDVTMAAVQRNLSGVAS